MKVGPPSGCSGDGQCCLGWKDGIWPGVAGQVPSGVGERSKAMKKPFRVAIAVSISIVVLLGAASPVMASPADPESIDELTSSVAYRADHADVLRLYRAFFDRQPDIAGALYWIGAYEDGATLDDIAWGFSNSKEFNEAYGSSLDNRAFLAIVYGNILDREHDSSGLEYWLGTMEDGLSQAGVVRWIAANAEFINRHPYTDLSAPLQSALLTLEDVPADWEQYLLVGRSTPDDSCDRVFRFPENAVFGFFLANNDSVGFLSHAMYAHVTVERAEDYMQSLQERLQDCATWVDEFGRVTTLEVMQFPELGDDSFAVRGEFGFPGHGDVTAFQYVHVRYGSTISGIFHSGRNNLFTALSLQWASKSTQRLIDLVGP